MIIEPLWNRRTASSPLQFSKVVSLLCCIKGIPIMFALLSKLRLKSCFVLFGLLTVIFAVHASQEEQWLEISTGYSHTLAVKKDGTLWGWGSNSVGSIGIDSAAYDISSPVQIQSDETWFTVSAGSESSLAIRSDGTLWAWGSNFNGELGDGTQTNRFKPVQVGTGNDWKAILSGEGYSLAIKSNGSLWAWGRNIHGELGDGTNIPSLVPKQIGTETDWQKLAKSTSFTSYAMKTDGSLWGWGDDHLQNTPYSYSSISVSWHKIVSSYDHTLAISSEGFLWGKGNNQSGQLGDGTGINRSGLSLLDDENVWIDVAVGSNHSIGIKNDGSLWAWGQNSNIEFGEIYSPVRISGRFNWKSVSSAGDYAIVLDETGNAYVWGGNRFGQLGLGFTANTNVPTMLRVKPENISSLSATNSGFSLLAGTEIWSWGINSNGVVGNDTTTIVNNPEPLEHEKSWSSLSSSSEHQVAIDTNGEIWSWGGNSGGLLGDGSTMQRNAPVQIAEGEKWLNTYVGRGVTHAIKEDGSLWAWGQNSLGYFGDGTTTDSLSPIKIDSGQEWLFISAPYGIKKDNTLWRWGKSPQEPESQPSLPTQFGTEQWRYISPASHVLAIKMDGTLWAWGQNSYGQQGIGSSSHYPSDAPIQVGESDDWLKVLAVGNRSFGLKNDGTLWAWGDSGTALGLENFNHNFSVPTQIAPETVWRDIAAGGDIAIALDQHGYLFVWGKGCPTCAWNNKLGLTVTKLISIRAYEDDDNDGVINYFDDVDDDGLPDDWERLYNLDPNLQSDALLDNDSDGLINLEEYLFGTDPNRSDTDNDGVSDIADAFPLDDSETLDTDGDLIGNNSDTDDDGDGIEDVDDNCPINSNGSQLNFDLDSFGDLCDEDIDNDGFSNALDSFSFDSNEWLDSNENSIGDNAERINSDFSLVNLTTGINEENVLFLEFNITISASFSDANSIQVLYWPINSEQTWVTLTRENAEDVFSKTILLPDYVKSGVYEIRAVIAIDNSGNEIRINDNFLNQGGYAYRTEIYNENSDNEVPELIAMTNSAPYFDESEQLHIDFSISAIDDLSGLNKSFIIELISPTGNSIQERGYFAEEGLTQASAELNFVLSKYSASGVYRVNTVRLYDLAGNLNHSQQWLADNFNTINIENPNSDSTPPTLNNVSMSSAFDLTVKRPIINISVSLSDNISGVKSSYVRLRKPDGGHLDSWMNAEANNSQTENVVFTKKLPLTSDYSPGDYIVEYFCITDEANNERCYYNFELNDLLLQSVLTVNYPDLDADGIPDELDAFPQDPSKWQLLDVGHDSDGDRKADILWRNTSTGQNWLWTMNGRSIIKSASITNISDLRWQIVGRGDFDGDGKSDILWRNSITGRNYVWLMDGFAIKQQGELNYVYDSNWLIKEVADLDGDGKDDIVWHHSTRGDTWIYLMNGIKYKTSQASLKVADLNWEIVASGDVNGDGKGDIIWRHKTRGDNYIWLMNGATISSLYVLNNINTNWIIAGAGDINGDGTDDIIWRNKYDGRNWAFLMNNGQIQSSQLINTVANNDWEIADISDLNGDGKADIFWRQAQTGQSYIFLMDGLTITSQGYSNSVSNNWQVIH
jgi:alpha-tubulin suppressor-like RCC1 family protein